MVEPKRRPLSELDEIDQGATESDQDAATEPAEDEPTTPGVFVGKPIKRTIFNYRNWPGDRRWNFRI